jgi:hypothetical protein
VAALRVMTTLVVAGLLAGAPGYARAQGQSGVGVVTTLVGEASVTRTAMAQEQALKRHDNVFPQDRITTKEHSLVHVLLGGKALLTVRELSVLTVTDEGGRATVDLHSGKVGLTVARERMRPGEVIEVYTPHTVAAVRGTVLVVEIVPDPAGGNPLETSTNVHLLHGKLDVSLRSNPGTAPVQLETLQSVTVSANALGAVRPLSPAAAAAVTANLKADQQVPTALPEKFQSALDERQWGLAVAAVALAVDSGAIRRGQVEQNRAETNGRGDERESGRNSNDDLSDAGDGTGAARVHDVGAGGSGGHRGSNRGGNDRGASRDGWIGRGMGSASGPGAGNGQFFGGGPGPGGNGVGSVVPFFQRKKGK